MTISGQNFEIYQGDNKVVIITVYDENDAILDLTGYSAVWCAYNQSLSDKVIIKSTLPGEGITIPSPTNGQLQITLDSIDTENLNPKTYGHQCEIENAGGSHSTVTVGYMKVNRSITHSEL